MIRIRRMALFAAAVAGVAALPLTALACDIDGKATAFADGHRAVRTTFTPATIKTWALFSFPGRYRANATIRFSEDQKQLRTVLVPEAMKRPWRWEFGDGTHGDGWTVTHRYKRAGIYRIFVEAYYPSSRQYASFDSLRLVVSR